MALSDKFDSSQSIFQHLCNAFIEIMKLVRGTDMEDFNSASEGIQEIIKDLEKFVNGNEIGSEDLKEHAHTVFEKPYIELPG